MPRHIPYSTTTISSLLTNCVFPILLRSCNHDTSHISMMQALPTAEWYREYPKPFAPGGRNFNIAKCCYGLCLTESDFGTLSWFIMEALQRSDVMLDEPSGLRCVDVKDKVNGVLKRVASDVGPCYGWSEIDEIDKSITVGYMFEMVKRSVHNQRRKDKAGGQASSARSDRPAGSQTPAEKCPWPTGMSWHGTLLETPAHTVSMLFSNPVMGQGPKLHHCCIHVIRVETGLEYKDTIDIFLNADSRNLHK